MKKIYYALTTIAYIICLQVNSYGQNNIAAGDLAFTSYQSDLDKTNYQFPPETSDFEDRFSMIVLKSGGIAGNSVIYITDNGWNSTTNNFLAVGNEGFIKWVVPSGGLAWGTEIYFVSTYNGTLDKTSWNAYTTEAATLTVGTVTTESTLADMSLSAAGDQILVYQTGSPSGPAAAYNDATRRFITAIHANVVANVTTYAAWDGPDPLNLSSSSLPAGLVNGVTAFLMSPGPFTLSNNTTEPDNGKFNCANAGSGCTAVEKSTASYTVANWTLNTDAFAIGFTSSHCSYTLPAAPVITGNPSALSLCSGLSASFTGSATGAASFQWQESANSTFTSPTTLTNAGVYSGVLTASLKISNNAGLNGKYYRLVVANGCGTTSNGTGALLTVASASLPMSTSTDNHAVDSSNNIYFGSSCGIISKVIASGPNPVTGTVSSKVWVESAVGYPLAKPFVQRHYEIVPATNAATATGTVTLYFSQPEFTAFNAATGSTLDLPTGPSDNAGKANLRIGKFSGTSSDSTGFPHTYNSTGAVIDPPDGNIVWNAVSSQWEVTFDVTGFSGFFVQTALQALPVTIVSFNAQLVSNDILVKWQTSLEVNNAYYEVERSLDGVTFTNVGRLENTNGNTLKNYSLTDVGAGLINSGKLMYRLKMVSIPGALTYSDIVVVILKYQGKQFISGVMPNPFKDRINLGLDMPSKGRLNLKVADLTGKVFIQETITVVKGASTYSIHGAGKLAPGVYFLTAQFEDKKFTYKIIK